MDPNLSAKYNGSFRRSGTPMKSIMPAMLNKKCANAKLMAASLLNKAARIAVIVVPILEPTTN